MKITSRLRIVFLCMMIYSSAFSQEHLEGKSWSAQVDKYGRLLHYIDTTNGTRDTISFRNDKYGGPSFENVILQKTEKSLPVFSSLKDGIRYQVTYKGHPDCLEVMMSIKNCRKETYRPKYERILLGLNTYMEKYPDWNYKYFPTMLRAEKTHFSGYAMSPLGRVFAFASPDPIASWNYEYQNRGSLKGHSKALRVWHRIYTVSLDMLHCLPLPERHPQHLTQLRGGEEKSIRLFLGALSSLDNLSPFYLRYTKAPVFDIPLYTKSDRETIKGKIKSNSALDVMVYGPQNYATKLKVKKVSSDSYDFEVVPNRGSGNYKLVATDQEGKVSEAILYFRKDWDWYLNAARDFALKAKPTDTHHSECFYPLYTYFLARRYLPNATVDQKCERVFNDIFPVLYDSKAKEMRNGKFRIQDASTMIGVMADRYQVTKDVEDLIVASNLVDFLISTQREDGAYYSGHNTHYTSVIYLAKSIMEYLTCIEPLAQEKGEWAERYRRQYDSVEKSIENLERMKDDIGTEGQMTFEDGMISCSATQLSFAALRSPDKRQKKRFLDASLLLTDKHQCLTMLNIPDARMNGATLRFWESQYTVNLMHGNMNTPCGWSAWKTYGVWYQYLLTGDEKYIQLVYNELGAFMQLIDLETGKFRFSFTPDPYIECEQYLETPIGSGKAALQPVVIGEQYIDAISDWHQYPNPTWRKKWGIDNFNHEVIKCMVEVSLLNAFIVEQEDGSFHTYGCSVVKKGDTLFVEAQEPLIENLHVNFKKQYDIVFQSRSKQFFEKISGLRWVNNIPDDIKEYRQMK
ncbi:hypothetical protein K5X82_08715 [Halosquirtibacter xylanolyticus]|uniref:hypothetical protein n=1 Tax=Halosquirtibacter xylanolyticus TaxID=3374599 RepID=UPI00374A433C|nr:hypothetical protein K5X82_08715 [Prolixibacteraceae bacterium]